MTPSFLQLERSSLITMQPDEICRLIEAGLTHTKAWVEGDGAHFTAIVVCPEFENKSRIQRQQLVYATVKPQLMDGTLHALSIKTFTPQEWQALNIEGNK